MLTAAQETAINSVAHYTIDFEQHEYSDQLEVIAEMTIANVTEFDNSDDLGGLTVYYKSDKLVAFYDYEQQRGTIFKDPVI
jgi:uncharacterized protein (DUF4213/DUF364 family)